MCKRYAETTAFERLCQHLSERFKGVTAYGPSDFAAFAEDDAFAVALGSYLTPPHEFDRAALIAAITPLVGALDEKTPPEGFAAMIADAIPEEVRMAKSGDALLRFEADRLLKGVQESVQSPATVGGVTVMWAPRPAQPALRRLAESDAAGAIALQRALEGRDLRAELPGLVAHPPQWLDTGGGERWKVVARLAEACGCWPEAHRANEERAKRPGADRAGALMAASGAAKFAGDDDACQALRDSARAIRPDHPMVRLVDIYEEGDAQRRVQLLDELGAPEEPDHQGIALAARCNALLELGSLEGAEAAAQRAVQAAPDHPAVREVTGMVVVVRNRQLRREGRATERQELMQAAETYRGLRDDLLSSRRYSESGWMLQRVAESQNLADRSDLARVTLGEATQAELAADEVPLALAEAAFNSDDRELAERLVAHYRGDDPAAELMRADLMLRDPERRQEGVAILDRHVAGGKREAAFLRLTAAVMTPDEVPWSDGAEGLVREQEPALASFIKAEWLDRTGHAADGRRELAKHADDPRALEELMRRFAEQGEWPRAAGFARALLPTGPSMRTRVMAAKVLRRSGAGKEAESVLRAVFNDPNTHEDERDLAFDELMQELLDTGRHRDARYIAEPAVAGGRTEAGWVVAYSLARDGDLAGARQRIEGLTPRNVGDARLAADLHFAGDSDVDALRAIVAIADALPEPDEQVELRATLALLRCGDAVPPDLVARANPMSFVGRFPRSRALRKESFTGENELPERLRAVAEQRARVGQEAEEHVLRIGDWPVGALAAAVSRTLAETWAMMPQLPLAYDGESLSDEVRIAQRAAGGPLVMDTGALYCLHLADREVIDAALTEYPLSQKPQATLDDIIHAVSLDLTQGQERVMHFAWDLETDQPLVTEMTRDQAEAPRRAAEAMQRIATRLHTTPAPVDSEASATGRDVIQRSYAEAVTAAQAASCPVYTDDRFFRRAMADSGVPMFGTLAVIQALFQSGALGESGYRHALARLRERGALGLNEDNPSA